MTSRVVTTKLLACTLLVLLAPLALAETKADPVQKELDRVRDLYRAITSYHILVQGEGVSKEMVSSALYDVEHYVAEIDERYGASQLFLKDLRALDEIKKLTAKAHFEAALLHARGVDLEGSITQYEKVVDLLGADPAEWQETVERTARPGLLSNAVETVYEVASPREAVEDLKVFWSSGVQTRFKVREYAGPQRAGLKLERIGGATDPFSEASFGIAAARFHDRLAAGLDEFRLVLPPGHYRMSSLDQTIPVMEFALIQGGIPDPIMINPNTFSFAFSTPEDKCHPTFTLNGLPVRSLQALPFGTYRVQAPAGCSRRLPEKITVDQNADVTLRTEPEKLDYVKEGQPIFLFVTTPPGSTYTLRM